MNSTNGRRNHDFQLAYFLAGSCHTPDAAWSLLCDLQEERETALALARAQALRDEAKRARAQAVVDVAINGDGQRTPAVVDALADVAELDAMAATTARNIAAAEAELTTIRRLQAALQPLRRFAHLPDADAHEAAQHDEWAAELLWRAENALLTGAGMTPELMGTLRMHPDGDAQLLPRVVAMAGAIRAGRTPDNIRPRPLLAALSAAVPLLSSSQASSSTP